jgi:hypothetical protein
MQREFLTHYVARVEVLNADCSARWIDFNFCARIVATREIGRIRVA